MVGSLCHSERSEESLRSEESSRPFADAQGDSYCHSERSEESLHSEESSRPFADAQGDS